MAGRLYGMLCDYNLMSQNKMFEKIVTYHKAMEIKIKLEFKWLEVASSGNVVCQVCGGSV